MKKSFAVASLSAVAIILAGCQMEKKPGGAAAGSSQKAPPMGIEASNFDAVAKWIEDSLTHSGKVTRTNVVSLGPVAISLDGPYEADIKTLRENLRALVSKNGAIRFNFAADAASHDRATAGRYRTMDSQWAKESAVDAESLRTLGSLANMNYILFGRVKSRTARTDKGADVTFTFDWKLGDCKTGLLVWTDQMEIHKTLNGK